MKYPYLRAKSIGRTGAAPESIKEHTEAVMRTASALADATGGSQLQALGLEPGRWLERLRREIKLAAFLHDLGKANDHFQGMVWKDRPIPQSIRHEAVSFWIATRPAMRDWLAGALTPSCSRELVLWAIAGHHRKFPPPSHGDDRSEVHVFLSRPDFREILAWGARELGLGEPPELADDKLRFVARDNVMREFEDAQIEAQARMTTLPDDERRYLALLKACLIGADVAGSIGRAGGVGMAEWIGEAFGNIPSIGQLDGIVVKRLEGRSLVVLRDEGNSRAAFQIAVGERVERVVYVRAGCGSGKTLAAYHWAARLAERTGRPRRLYFCYPTMGTATEGYRDYLKDADVEAALVHSRAEIDMKMLGLGDDEPDASPSDRDEDQPGRPSADSAATLDLWSTPLVSCTVDTVLGLLQNQRKGIFAWPSIAGAAIVFDELHSYDNDLFAALLRFLTEVHGVPCLLMTASLPTDRLAKIRAALEGIGEALGEVSGPEHLETIVRYRRDRSSSPWVRVHEVLRGGGKVLWVVNTVNDALDLAGTDEARAAGAILYHSRFRYVDRMESHKKVIAAFAEPKGTPALAVTTQVAEMSLDLSADLLVTQLAPIPSLIQRLGRLNRRAEWDDPWPFLVYEPKSRYPYETSQLEDARLWLDALGDGPLSQKSLVEKWTASLSGGRGRSPGEIWLDGGFVTEPRPLREASPGIEIILERDRDDVASKRKRPEEVRVPMPPPKDRGWLIWPEVAFCKVPPDGRIEYDETRGARWKA